MSTYKQTLNLPQTAFPMEAKLTANEPARLAAWTAADLYNQIQAARADAPAWVLHDGPPFANGDIHIGHVINKTLKDVLLRYKTMRGFRTPYVPGWDCHGLPIEHKIADEAKKAGERLHELGAVEVRRRCYAYAAKYAAVQSEQFQRLGILGDWAHPYLTMTRDYEASTLEVFAKFVEAGLVYRKLKPVPWSIANQTALADAELEYRDVDDNSVYVEFELVGEGHPSPDPSHATPNHEPVSLLIWTTTPWTLPANLAIAAGPDVEYVRAKYTVEGRARTVIVAADLVQRVFQHHGGTAYHVVGVARGSELAGLEYRHPFVDRVGKVVLADYVTTDAGTGLVHTAPGHGEDDYETGLREKMDVYSPVLANGKYDDTVPEWLRGKSVWEANKLIPPRLKELGVLFAEEKINHSYPHDWRSKTPVIYRATEQWFVAMDKPYVVLGENGEAMSLRSRSLLAINVGAIEAALVEGKSRLDELDLSPVDDTVAGGLGELLKSSVGHMRDPVERSLSEYGGKAGVSFVPEWGRRRIDGMVRNRPDWCVSRQRAWGLPIPVFYNDRGDALLTPASVRAVVKRVAAGGSDVWFTEEPATLLGADFVYPPGFTATALRKENDIFDVWFESGSSWHAVLEGRPALTAPADLYLEGSDQHRGWFQLSLLTSLGATGQPPFKQVLTHGFAVKPDGTKWSKQEQDKNADYPHAMKMMSSFGADPLRFWVCSLDFEGDIPSSFNSAKDFSDKYRKVRNTVRFLLSNLYDYDPTTAAAPVPPASLDGWMLGELDRLVVEITAAYDRYQLHRAFRLLYDFCSVELSSVYGNAMKDRLYCDAAGSPPRRRSQAVMHRVVTVLTKLLAPMIVFTADEAWASIPGTPAGQSVHLTRWPVPSGQAASDEVGADWLLLMSLRSSALGQLDELKKAVGLNKAGEAAAVYDLPDGTRERLATYGVDLEDAVGCGHASVEPAATAGVRIVDARQTFAACARCWKRRPDVTGELCGRCAAAIAST